MIWKFIKKILLHTIKLRNSAHTDTSQNQTDIKQDRQRTYKRNIQARSFNHCCRGKVLSVTLCVCVCVWVCVCVCVFVALRILHAMRMRHIIICSLPSFTIFFHIIS